MSHDLSSPGVPPVASVVNAAGKSPYVLICEHACNHIPPEYGDLGVSWAERQRHIAWDIGAEAVSRRLAARLDAPLFLSGISRLVIDANRPPGVPSSIPVVSEATEIPGNFGLTEEQKADRVARFFTPFHSMVAAHLDARRAQGRKLCIVAMHSFTPVYLGVARPWHAGVLYIRSEALGRAMIDELARDPTLVVGDNEPYRSGRDSDYAIPVHGDDRNLPAILMEIRQDLIGHDAGAAEWAGRMEAALTALQPRLADLSP